MDRRTDEQLANDRLIMAEHIIDTNPTKTAFYKEYTKRFNCSEETAKKEYKHSLKLVGVQLKDNVDISRANRLLFLYRMIDKLTADDYQFMYEFNDKSGKHDYAGFNTILAVEKQIAELEGVKVVKMETESIVKTYNLND